MLNLFPPNSPSNRRECYGKYLELRALLQLAYLRPFTGQAVSSSLLDSSRVLLSLLFLLILLILAALVAQEDFKNC